MSLVLRLKTADAASRAAPLAGETVPEVLPPPQPALLDWATLTPAADSHLAPCPHCGAPNGLSASSCWNCEEALAPRDPLWQGATSPQAALVPQHASADADASFPVLTLAVKANDAPTEHPRAAAPTPTPVPEPAAGERRYTGVIGVSIFVLAVAAMAAALYFDAPQPRDAAKSGGFISPPEPAALATAPPAPAPPARLPDTAGVPPAAVKMPRTDALRALAVGPGAPVAAPTPGPLAVDTRPTSAAPPAAVGKVRSPSRPANEAATLAVPKRDVADVYVPRQAPAPARPCTPTVAALGLCTGPPGAPAAPAPPTESKE